MDNLNNGFTNPNAPSDGATQNSFGGNVPVQPQPGNTNSVYNSNSVSVPPMDTTNNQAPMSQPDPMAQFSAPVTNDQSVNPMPQQATPVMDNNVAPQASGADSFQSDLDALKALADELNSAPASEVNNPPVAPMDFSQPQSAPVTAPVGDISTPNPVAPVMDTPSDNTGVDPISGLPSELNSAPSVAPLNDNMQSDMDALKALSDELNAMQSNATSEPIVQPMGEVPTMEQPNPTVDMGMPTMDVNTPDPALQPINPVRENPAYQPTPMDAGNQVQNDFDALSGIPTSETPTPDPMTQSANPVMGDVNQVQNDLDALNGAVNNPTPDPMTQPVAPTMDNTTFQPTPVESGMDVNALSSNPWEESNNTQESVQPAPVDTMNANVPPVDQRNEDLAMLNSLTPQDMTLPQNDPTTAPVASMDMSQTPPVENSFGAPTPQENAPAFGNMTGDLSQPLPSVQENTPVVENQQENNDDVINTLSQPEEGKESSIIIIMLVVLIVLLLAGIGYFAYQIFLK